MNNIIFKTNEKLKSSAYEFLKLTGLLSAFSDSSDKYIVFPGFCDVHVHFREPGFSYKETIRSGSMAAAHGGYSAVCTMPNVNPVPDSSHSLKLQTDIIEKNSVIRIFPYGSITMGQKGEELSFMESIAGSVCAFSDDGKGVQSSGIMKEAMIKAKKCDKIIAAHCEDNILRGGGCIHDGIYAKNHMMKGITSASEYVQIERDLKLAGKIGAKYHVCHVSAKESVELIKKAKAEGIDVTCETAPHYLVLSENDLRDDGRWKMNPPLRGEEDRLALIEGVRDGTIDIIATDHAPHSREEKSMGLKDSLMGIVGLETAFPVLYTKLVMTGIISKGRLLELISENPKKRFNIDTENDFTVFEMSKPFEIDPELFESKGRATPFDSMKVYGKCVLTVSGGKIAWIDKKLRGDMAL